VCSSDLATDSGVSTTAYRTVVVADRDAPIITIKHTDKNPVTVSQSTNFTYSDLGVAIFDNYDAPGDVTINSNVNVVNRSVLGTYTFSYTATDTSGNVSNTAYRTVVVAEDIVPPVITLIGTNPYTVDYGRVYTDPGTNVTDDADINLTSTLDQSGLNMNQLGTYTVSYTAQDNSGNSAETVYRTVVVKDLSGPEITVLGANPLTIDYSATGETYTDIASATSITDLYDQTASVTTDISNVVTSVPGTYQVKYSSTDVFGNTATDKYRTVVVVDRVAPVITFTTNPHTLETNATNPYEGYGGGSETAVSELDDVVAHDFIDGSLSVTNIYSNFNKSILGTYSIGYKATDSSGNSATLYRTVVVRDTTTPQFVYPANDVYPADLVNVECLNTQSTTAIVNSDGNNKYVFNGGSTCI
jgi:hypothetical protein